VFPAKEVGPTLLVFPSDTWLTTWLELANNNRRFNEASVGWSGSVGCVIQLAVQPEARLVWWRLSGKDGTWTSHQTGSNISDLEQTKFTITATRENWRAMLVGEVGPVAAMVSGRARLSGQLSQLLRCMPALKIMVELAGGIETDFSAFPSREGFDS
jgi:putative sterol carrier protein